MDADAGGTVVMLTALNLEYDAIRTHLTSMERIDHPAGTIFEAGRLPSSRGRVILAVTGEGNAGAAVLTERAITTFRPKALLFVGVAGALKDDIALGDVVVATKVYSYHGGKEEDEGFFARPRAWEIPHHLAQVAQYIARTGAWRALIPGREPSPIPSVHFKPIAAGEVVLNSRETPLAHQLRRNYGDAVAIEMESAGVSQAGHLNRSLPVLTVRGISDKADGAKRVADAAGWQSVAALNAATFALALAEDICASTVRSAYTGRAEPSDRTVVQHVVAQAGGAAYGVADGSMNVYQHGPNHGPIEGPVSDLGRDIRWQALNEPVAVTWRDDLVNTPGQGHAALELHLVPRSGLDRLEMRRLAVLPDELAEFGRSRGLFTASEQLSVKLTDRAAWVATTDYRNGPAGLAVMRTGQRSAWKPLPHDTLGAILDSDNLVVQIGQLMALLVAIKLPPTDLMIPAVGIAPVSMVAEGRVSSMPRSSASLGFRQTPLRLPAEDALTYRDLLDHASSVAEELAARVLALFRNSR